MLPDKYQWILREFEPEGDPRLLLGIAVSLEEDGDLASAGTVYDRAYGLDPTDADIVAGRARVLDALAVTEHGLTFRYVPGGVFLMGSRDGDEDERPLHPVWLAPFWMADIPVTWDLFNRAMGWPSPGVEVEGIGGPPDTSPDAEGPFDSYFTFRMCMHYSESDGDGSYDHKPMVAVSWTMATEAARRLSSGKVRYLLPSEAQWEKAARGGLIAARYPWGDAPPTPDRCDFGHIHDPQIRSLKVLPPNGYGLYAMCGGVWEWTRDWYDRDAYREHVALDPEGPEKGKERVLRGGSWIDTADAFTVSFRGAAVVGGRSNRRDDHLTPTIGFRLCRVG